MKYFRKIFTLKLLMTCAVTKIMLQPWFKFNNCKCKQIGERTPSTDCYLPLRPLSLVVAYISCPFTYQIPNKFVILYISASGLHSIIFHVSRSLDIISHDSGLVPPSRHYPPLPDNEK